jgi:hypothetical protein
VPDGSSKDKSKGANKASKEALAIHKKWQAEAVKLGGPDVKIEVSKPKAKKLIFYLTLTRGILTIINGLKIAYSEYRNLMIE